MLAKSQGPGWKVQPIQKVKGLRTEPFVKQHVNRRALAGKELATDVISIVHRTILTITPSKLPGVANPSGSLIPNLTSSRESVAYPHLLWDVWHHRQLTD